jgi:DNA-binding beta-propeller fold protein YncE
MQFPAIAAFLFLWFALGVQERKPTPSAGENRQATSAEINDPMAIAVDGSTLYVAEFLGAIRRIDLKSGIITSVPLKTRLSIDSLVVSNDGNLIATEYTVGRLCRIDPQSGSLTTIAGGKRFGFSGDGGPAINAELGRPSFVAIDAANNLFIADEGNMRIRRVDAKTGIITTVAGSGKRDSTGDGRPALDAGLDFPNSVALDRDGNLFIAQYGYGSGSHRIRRVDAKSGIITTIAGSATAGLIGDGGPALSASLESPSHLLFDRMGGLYVVDPANDRVRFIDGKTQTIKTVAGSTKGFGGDGGPATLARLDNPSGLALDSEGNLYIAEFVNHRVRRVDARTGVIRTVAGNGFPHHMHVLASVIPSERRRLRRAALYIG